jgi:hypothetical protein
MTDLVKIFLSTLLFSFVAVQAAGLTSAQVRQDTADKPENKTEAPLITIELVGGGRLEVEELRETSDGVWYKQGGVTTLLDRTRVARIKRPSDQAEPVAAAAQDSPRWSLADSRKVENFFFTKFGRPLPTSAFGQSEIHDRWGLDHRQGLDVGLHPDSQEGIALVDFLRAEKIPYLVFRHAIPGVATGPHIHIGFPSHRYLRR